MLQPFRVSGSSAGCFGLGLSLGIRLGSEGLLGGAWVVISRVFSPLMWF